LNDGADISPMSAVNTASSAISNSHYDPKSPDFSVTDLAAAISSDWSNQAKRLRRTTMALHGLKDKLDKVLGLDGGKIDPFEILAKRHASLDANLSTAGNSDVSPAENTQGILLKNH
jgi:hypothetical protein